MVDEEVHRAARQVLSASQEFGRSRLGSLPANMGGLVLKVEDEPQLDAGI